MVLPNGEAYKCNAHCCKRKEYYLVCKNKGRYTPKRHVYIHEFGRCAHTDLLRCIAYVVTRQHCRKQPLRYPNTGIAYRPSRAAYCGIFKRVLGR